MFNAETSCPTCPTLPYPPYPPYLPTMRYSDLTRLRFHVLFSIAVAIVALLVTWLLLGDGSPLASYFAQHGEAKDLWRVTVVLPFLFSAVIAGNPHSPPLALVIAGLLLQWLIVGFVVSIPVARRRARHGNK